MKIFIILFFSTFLFMPQISNAQLALGGVDKGFLFGFNVGENVPMSGYGSTSQGHLPLGRMSGSDTNTMSGYAAPLHSSFHYDFYAGYKIFPHVDIMIECNEDFNRYDIKTANTEYQVLMSSSQVSVTTGDNFNVTQFLAGPYFFFPLSGTPSNVATKKHHSFQLNPIGNNLSIELKLLVGITSANYPSIYFNGLAETNLYTFTSGRGFGYFGSVGLKYDIVDGVGFHLDVNYEGSAITYPNYSVSTYYNPNMLPASSYTSSEYNTQKTMLIGLVQITIGFSFEI